MRVMVTNDDGIDAPGIEELVRHIYNAGHDVVVVAPLSDWSGGSLALSSVIPEAEIAVERRDIAGAEDVEALAVDGSPAATVILAMRGILGDPPDVVVSGINNGANIGRSVMHSGTVGAALTAQNLGVTSMAVSQTWSETADYSRSAELATDLLDVVKGQSDPVVVNLNVPIGQPVKGIRWGRLDGFGSVRTEIQSQTESTINVRLEVVETDAPEDTDRGLLERGFASLTSLAGVCEVWQRAGNGLVAIEPTFEFDPEIEIPHPLVDQAVLRRPDF